LQHEERRVDHRVLRHRRRRRDHDRDRQGTAQSLARGGQEAILEHAPHFLAPRRQIREDHTDVARPCQDTIARPLGGKIELGGRIVGRDDFDAPCLGWRCFHVRDPLLCTPALDQPRHRRRHRVETGKGELLCRHQLRIVCPLRKSRLVDGIERSAAAFELATPRVERLRFRRIEGWQPLEGNKVVVQPAPAAGGKPCGIRRIEEIACRAAASDDVVPEDSRLRGSQNSRSRGSM
jgi:hypothetical protein